MVAKARSAASTVLCGTRYGNVMGSRGSVIPLFLAQAARGEPLTLTDPEMTRFMMTLEDAVNLVLYAYAHAEPGDVFVQKAPAATLSTLATAIERLTGREVGSRIIGTRHGEKRYETLLTREEMARSTDLGKYFRIPADNRDLNYAQYFTHGEEVVSHQEDYTSNNTHQMTVSELELLLRNLDFVSEALAGRRAD